MSLCQFQKERKFIKDENIDNLYYAIHVDGEVASSFPSKDSGYILDTSLSSCNNGVTVSWDAEAWVASVDFSNYQKEEMGRTKCSLYFMEQLSITEQIIAQLDKNGNCPTFNANGVATISSVESTNAYLCSAPDDYGTSYYYRGNVTNNWVKFANAYWRIVRINGDGSIRLIYAGNATTIDSLDATTKTTVLANGYDDSSTDYTQIGTSYYNYYWKKDNVQESVNSEVVYDNAALGYMYGNRDGVVEGSTQHSTSSHSSRATIYYAQSYSYNAETDRFTLVNPVGVLVSDMSEDYIGWYSYDSQ